jgi:hypothetical protein
VACSLTDVLALLPTPSDPFVLGPRDYLSQFLTLLSTLRNGDSRFLPLLLSKVHDVLPRLASPMLQTVPEPNPACGINPNIDIFDGFGNAGMGVPSSLPVHFDTKRIEELSSPSDSSQERDNAPFTTPPIMQSSMEYPGLADYNSFPDLSAGLNNHGHSQGPMPQMPMRQNSISAPYTMIPRSVAEFQSNISGLGLGLRGDLYR